MYAVLDKKESTEPIIRTQDIEHIYGPPILKKNRRFKGAAWWGLAILVLLIVVIALLVILVVLAVQAHRHQHQIATPVTLVTDLSGGGRATPTQSPGATAEEGRRRGEGRERTQVVALDCGTVQGVVEDGVNVFKGIPYAVPPLGALRWKPPSGRKNKPELCDTAQARNATDYGNKCLQWDSTGERLIGNEDCLFANVWTPELATSEGLEIMVFIHGGGTQTELGHLYGAGLLTGSGHEPGMVPNPELVRSANMVFVTFNYRLGPLGFLAVNVKDPTSGSAINGNMGLMDQHQALEWVRDNARAFGGDPEKITVFGVGAGASSILIHLASSQTPVFRSGWVASPAPHYNTTLSMAYQQNTDFLRNTACGGSEAAVYRCLLDLNPQQVFSAYPAHKWHNRQFYDLPTQEEVNAIRGLIIVDDTFLTNAPYITWSTDGDRHNIPLIIGNTAQEVEDWPLPLDLPHWDWIDYEEAVFQRLSALHKSDLAAMAQQLYPKTGDVTRQYTSMISDLREICPVSAVAKLLGHYWKEPVYRYVADVEAVGDRVEEEGEVGEGEEESFTSFKERVLSGHRLAYHSIDMLSFFNANKLPAKAGEAGYSLSEPSGITGASEGQASTEEAVGVNEAPLYFSRQLRYSVFEFVRTGQVSNWTLYPNSTVLVSSQSIEQVPAYHASHCELWRSHGLFPQFAWMH